MQSRYDEGRMSTHSEVSQNDPIHKLCRFCSSHISRILCIHIYIYRLYVSVSISIYLIYLHIYICIYPEIWRPLGRAKLKKSSWVVFILGIRLSQEFSKFVVSLRL